MDVRTRGPPATKEKCHGLVLAVVITMKIHPFLPRALQQKSRLTSPTSLQSPDAGRDIATLLKVPLGVLEAEFLEADGRLRSGLPLLVCCICIPAKMATVPNT